MISDKLRTNSDDMIVTEEDFMIALGDSLI